jgi:cyclophilin family peptidyl-prolyl cis-trans isomerase
MSENLRPKPEVKPNTINFHDLKARETRKETFVIKNSGGPFSKISISEPPPWIKINRKTPVSANDKLPLSIEIEASGDKWGKTYSDKIVIKLDDIETQVKVKLSTRRKPKTMGTRQWLVGISLVIIIVVAVLIWRSNIFSNNQEHTANPTNTPAASSTAASAANPADRVRSWTTPPAMQISTSKKYTASVNTTLGSFKIQLLPQDSPKTVNNFVFLSRQGFYNGVIFHRIMKTFMIQTGDPLGTGMGDPGYKFADELPAKYPYDEGIVAMANSGPNTNGSQFFICTGADSRNLNRMPNYTQFGKIIEGMDTVQKIAGVPVSTSASGESSKPVNAPVITSITITEQ